MALSATGLNSTSSVAERATAYAYLASGQGNSADNADDVDSETNNSVASSMTSMTTPHYPVNLPRQHNNLGPGLVVTTPAGIDLPAGGGLCDTYGSNMPRSRSMEGSRNLGSTTTTTSLRSSSTHRVKTSDGANTTTQTQQPNTNWSSIDSNTSEMTSFELDSAANDNNKRMSMPNIGGDDSPSSRHRQGKGFKHLLKNWTRKSASDKRGMFSKTKSEQHGDALTSSIDSSEVFPVVAAAGLQAMSAGAPAAANFTRTRNVSGDSSTMSMSSTVAVDHQKKFAPSSTSPRPTSSASSSTNRTYVKPPSSESDGESVSRKNRSICPKIQ